MSLFKQYLAESEIRSTRPVTDDSFDLMINETLCIESVVLEDSDDAIVIQADEKVFEILEALDMLEESDRMLRKRDLDFIVHVRDNYYVNITAHREDDNFYETYDLIEKVKDVDDQMTPAYKDLGIIHELPARRASEEEIKQAAENMIAELGGTEEPAPTPDQPPMDQEVQPGTPDQMAEMRRLAGLSEAGIMDKVKSAFGMGQKPASAPTAAPAPAAPAVAPTAPAPVGAKVTYKGETYEKQADGMWDGSKGTGIPKNFPEWKAIEAEYAKGGQGPAAGQDPYVTSHGAQVIQNAFGQTMPAQNIQRLLYPGPKGAKAAAVVMQFPNKKFYEITWNQGGYAIRPSKENQTGYYAQQLDMSGKQYVRGAFRPYEMNMAEDAIDEAEYQGHSVSLGKPTTGDVKKFKVYVRDPKSGNIKKVNFGDPNMEIKRDNPERRKNFRARHNCADKKDRTKAGYWSCRMWSKKPVSKIV